MDKIPACYDFPAYLKGDLIILKARLDENWLSGEVRADNMTC
jgi:hypothetical protein